MTPSVSSLFVFLFLSPFTSTTVSASIPAYPTIPGTTDTSISSTQTENLIPNKREVYGNGRIIDITHRYTKNLPSYKQPETGIGQFLWLSDSIKNGSVINMSEFKLSAHAGTHVDAPGHFFDHYFDAGFDVDSLDLEVLNGPGLVIDVPRDSNITAEVFKSLKIPRGIHRVIFKTLNTDRKLMYKSQFDTSYVGLTKDGAEWLVNHTDIKLIGIDYLSVAEWNDNVSAHLVLLERRDIIIVEALKLDDVKPGIYSIHCLPLRLVGAEGSPIRCILIN